jgi:predicted amidohydrolase
MVLAAVCQLTSSASIPNNLSVCLSLLKRSAAAGAKAVFFPEASDFISSGSGSGPPGEEVARLTRSRENEEFVRGLREGARNEGVWVSVGVHEDPERPILVGGSTTRAEELNRPVMDGKRCFNSHLIIDDRGEVALKYRKTHLFDVDIAGGLRIKER